MSDTADTSTAKPPRRFRFSIGTLLLLTAIVGLTANAIVTSRRIAMLKQQLESQERELSALSPLPPEEVARQFEKNTTLGPISVSVKDVRYSPDSDSYKVDFSWTDSNKTSQTWNGDVILNSDGYGAYHGEIRHGPFIKPLGRKEAYSVVVKTPSPLTN